ncbi:MAG TPA: nucleotidyltransferase domain-containing protein [Phycisphaerales bacterium]|nr:nucleotidyltransferase domain-containing protein [Phycisphaerales bacterium]
MFTVTESDIQELAAKIAAEFKPRKVILFGSRAYGTPHDDSDVDLLVVMPYDGSWLDITSEIAARIHPHRFPIDVIVRTPEEMKWRYEGGDPIIREAVDRGRVLYEAAA